MPIDLNRILNDLQSKNASDCIYAIRACCIQNISNEQIAEILVKLKYDDRVAMMSKVSNYALAALDLLDIEKYIGNDSVILEYIDTVFYTNKENFQEVDSITKNTSSYKFGILDTTSTDDIEKMEKLLEEKYIKEKTKEDH